jgi:molybdopterin-guanine dinucleotide biosynthesis protein
MDFADSALLIMAGGKSSRLGQDKLFLEYDGTSLLERLLQKAAARDFREVFLCGGRDVAACAALAAKYGIRFLPDEVGGRGPLAGLC